MTGRTDIARLKITLDDVKPQVLRRIEVPVGIKLDRLHAALQGKRCSAHTLTGSVPILG